MGNRWFSNWFVDGRQDITWTNGDLLPIEPFSKKLQWNINRSSDIFNAVNGSQSAFCKVSAIFLLPQCVKRSVLGFVSCLGERAYRMLSPHVASTTYLSSIGVGNGDKKLEESQHHDIITWKHFPHYWPLWVNPPDAGRLPSQRASSA